MYTWQLRNRVLSLGPRCLVMGIVNVTPDSFSDGGAHFSTERAVSFALEMVQQGADILDIGGESTRPGSLPVSLEEELARVLPVVTALAQQKGVPLSVDTSKAAVARACLQAGAQIINDVTGLTGDPDMVDVVRDFRAGAIVMHMQGTPATMQVSPRYDDVLLDLSRWFEDRLQFLAGRGIPPEAVMLDPGIGFGKKQAHNMTILANLRRFTELGRPLCLGVSRKGLIDKVLSRPLDQRVAGALTIGAYGLAQDAVHVLRVHDVAPTSDLVRMWEALRNFTAPSEKAEERKPMAN